jgi:hypothetical protein
MVGLGGLEPPTSPLSGVRSNHLSYRPKKSIASWKVRTWKCGLLRGIRHGGGASRDRTDDPLLAKQVLSQLSYGPVVRGYSGCRCLVWAPVRSACRAQKEVIQPHLPIRLPCYDFTPVIGHTVASALPKVKLPASGATNSHGVTGGVYKARERIHRSNADLRLLAIPTSWSRVADSNPD